MKIYFLSSQPCALTINGVFFGVTDTFERSAELALSDRLYVQFSPEGRQAVGFFLTDEILQKAPVGCEVYLLKNALAVYACYFPPVDFTLRPIAQKREGDTLATLFTQGDTQLSIESPEGFFNATLPPSFADCEMTFHRGFILLKSPSHLAVFNARAERLLLEEVRSYSLDKEILSATLPLSDSVSRTADCQWKLSEKECVLQSFSLRQAENARPPLLPYAFFETALLKGDYGVFLSEELQKDKENIRAFLGDFIAVTLTEKEDTCGLVKRKGERLFAVEYYSVEMQDGVIVDVRG